MMQPRLSRSLFVLALAWPFAAPAQGYADEERDWERLARAALPDLPKRVFDARFAMAIEAIIVGVRTPSPTPGAVAVKLPHSLHARADLVVDFVVAGMEGPV